MRRLASDRTARTGADVDSDWALCSVTTGRCSLLDSTGCRGGGLNLIASVLKQTAVDKMVMRLRLDLWPPFRGQARDAG